jgi:hypothetical protein
LFLEVSFAHAENRSGRIMILPPHIPAHQRLSARLELAATSLGAALDLVAEQERPDSRTAQ